VEDLELAAEVDMMYFYNDLSNIKFDLDVV
jgi:hypothetical protein